MYIINFPEGIVSIGEGAFSSCVSLRRVIFPDSLQQIGEYMFYKCILSVLRLPPKLNFLKYVYGEDYISYLNTKKFMSLSYDSVGTVICSGSDYDLGYRAIDNANSIYFLGETPQNVDQILDRDTVRDIYCSDEFEFEWTRSTVASWVRQRLTILPADQIKTLTETAINTTPVPTNTPKPIVTPRPTETPWPTPMPRPTASPIVTVAPEQQTTDPMLLVFGGVLAAVVAGIVIVAMNRKKTKKHNRKKSG